MIKTLWLSIFTDLLLAISLWLHSSEHKVVLFCVFLKEAPITRSLFFTPSFIWTETFSSRSVFCLNLANAEGQHTRKKKMCFHFYILVAAEPNLDWIICSQKLGFFFVNINIHVSSILMLFKLIKNIWIVLSLLKKNSRFFDNQHKLYSLLILHGKTLNNKLSNNKLSDNKHFLLSRGSSY